MARSSALDCFALHCLRAALPVLLFLCATATSSQAAPQTILFVNPSQGSDRDGDGSVQYPLRTITAALERAPRDRPAIVQLQAGTYDSSTGEIFPIALRPGIMLLGNEPTKGRGIVITGGASFKSPTFGERNVALVASDRSEIRGITIVNRQPQGYGLWIEAGSPVVERNTFTANRQDGIWIAGDATAAITNNSFLVNDGNGITITGTARPTLRGNTIRRSTLGIAISQKAAPLLTENTISDNLDGIVAREDATPLLRGNTIEKNRRYGLLASDRSQPNLGTPDNPGNNIFRGNRVQDALNQTTRPIPMAGNQFPDRIPAIAVKPSSAQPNTKPQSVALAAPPKALNSGTRSPLPPPLPSDAIVVPVGSDRPTAPVPTGSAVTPELPPIVQAPPAGDPVNQPIVLAPKATIAPIAAPPRYRVVVPVASELTLQSIRQIAPSAFPLRREGKLSIQVGAYSNRAIAREQIEKLARAGYKAIVETIVP